MMFIYIIVNFYSTVTIEPYIKVSRCKLVDWIDLQVVVRFGVGKISSIAKCHESFFTMLVKFIGLLYHSLGGASEA